MSEQPIIIVKKKGHGGHAHHGGSWKVAYADFVTAMMAFFMVLWIMGLSAPTKKLIAGYFNDPLGVSKTAPFSKSIIELQGSASSGKNPSKGSNDGENPIATEEREMKKVAQSVQKTLGGSADLQTVLKDITVTVTPEGLVIELNEKKGTAFFDSGQFQLKPQGKTLVKRLAPILLASHRQISISGYTDARPYGGTGYTNMELSADRGMALYQALLAERIPEDRFNPTIANGAKHLKDPEHPYDAINRRVTILLPRLYRADDKTLLPQDQAQAQGAGQIQPPITIAPPHPNIREPKAKDR